MLLTESEERQRWQCIKVTEVKMKLGEWRKEKEEKPPVQPELNQQLSVDIACFQIQMPLCLPFLPLPFLPYLPLFLVFSAVSFPSFTAYFDFCQLFLDLLPFFLFLSCFPLGYFFS